MQWAPRGIMSYNMNDVVNKHRDKPSRSLNSKVVYKASCWDCDDCYIGKTKRRLHDRKTEHFKALTSNSHSSAIADLMTQLNEITLTF